jgi:hypothetical protein
MIIILSNVIYVRDSILPELTRLYASSGSAKLTKRYQVRTYVVCRCPCRWIIHERSEVHVVASSPLRTVCSAWMS